MFAAVVIPNFHLHAVLRHEPALQEAPIALLLDDSKKARIHQLTAAAEASGVRPGMTSTQAKARCSGIGFRLRSPAQEEAAHEILLEAAYQSAAFLELTEPGICTIDLRGLAMSSDNASSLKRWADQLIQRLDTFSLPPQVGLAAAPGLALQAARTARRFLHVTDPRAFWRTLPLADLMPPANLLEILRKWGITTAAQFIDLGKGRIAERLGPEGLAFFEQARADHIRPLNLTAPKLLYEESFEFEQTIEMLEPLLFMLRRFLDQLTRRMEHAALVIQQLDLALLLDSGERHERTLEIPSPNRDVEILFRIVHNYLENVRTAAPVKALFLRARPAAAEAQQFQLFESAIRDPNQFYETIGRLNALLGADRVGVPRVEPTHRPDDIRLEPITAQPPSRPALETPPVRRGLMLRRFRPPLPASVRLRETTPIFVRCSRVAASITHTTGPWRTSGHWWESAWGREEWDVQTKDGGLYRLFRDSTGWFIEGAYD